MEQKDVMKAVPGVKELEKFYSKRINKLSVFAFVIIILDCWLFYDVFFINPDHRKLWFKITLLSFLLIILIARSYKPIFSHAVNISRLNDEKIGEYHLEEIKAIINEVTHPLRVNHEEIPNVYFTKKRDLMAFSINLSILNFIKRLNAIYISEDSFHILKKDELRALLAHETGHFTRYTSVNARFPLVNMFFVTISPLKIIQIFKIESIIWAIPVGMVSSYILLLIISLFEKNLYKKLEYLADYYAASRYGTLNVINGLFQISKLGEGLVYFYQQIIKRVKRSSNYSHLDLPVIVKYLEQMLPHKILTKGEMDKFIRKGFRRGLIKRLQKKLSGDDIESRNERLDAALLKLTGKDDITLIDWNLFDFDVKDLRVNEKEYPHLIKALLDNPRGQLINTINDNIMANIHGTHPTLRERILFLHKNIPPQLE